MENDNLGMLGLLRESYEARVRAAEAERDRALEQVKELRREMADVRRSWTSAILGDLVTLTPAEDDGEDDE